MENRSNDFEPPLHEIDKRVTQIEECLTIQLKPAAQWFEHIECVCNEVDDTISSLLGASKEQINRKSYRQLSNLSVDLLPSNRLVSGSLSPTIAQFQDIASKAQKELYGLKSQIQKDSSAMNLRQP